LRAQNANGDRQVLKREEMKVPLAAANGERRSVMGLFTGILDLFFPPRCVFCRKFLEKGEKEICASCLKELPFCKGAAQRTAGDFFSECVSPFYYKDEVRESILRFKFRGASQYAKAYGRLLADCIRQNLSGKYDLITWVPLNEVRLAERTYDQAALLAMAAALELEDVAAETLKKIRNVQAQSGISEREKRKANVSGAYVVKDEELIAGKRILLIDDIVTTGSTLAECSRVLLTAGAARVVCATLAKAAE